MFRFGKIRIKENSFEDDKVESDEVLNGDNGIILHINWGFFFILRILFFEH